MRIAFDVFPAGDPNTRTATLSRDTRRAFRKALNDPGSIGFELNRHVAEASPSIVADGNFVKVRCPEYPALGYVGGGILEKSDATILAAQEKGDEDVKLGGRGLLAYLDRAIMWNEAFTTGLDISDKYEEVWHTDQVPKPTGVAYLTGDPDYVYAISATTRRIYKIRQSDHKVVATSPALWSGSTSYAGGLTADPSDASVMWALEAPWALGGGGNTKIRKIDISGSISSWNVVDTLNLGSAVKLSDIYADASHLWTSRYDTGAIQERSKSTGNVTDSHTIVYNGVTQTKANGVAISESGSGSEIAMWFGGTGSGGVKRVLIANVATPETITRKISTQEIASFGGDWTLESSEQFFYVVSYTLGRVWKYRLTAATPHDPVDGTWRLDEATPGAILRRIIDEAQASARPQHPLPDLTGDYTYTVDSDGDAWATHEGTTEFDARIGESVLDTVLRLLPFGLVVQMQPDLELLGLNTIGTDRTGGAFGAGIVRFVAGDDGNIVPELPRMGRERPLHTNLLAEGRDSRFATAELADLGYVREGFISTDLEDLTALAGTAEAELDQERVDSIKASLRVTVGDDPEAGLYIPFRDYDVGDVVRVHTGTGPRDFDEQDLRVYAIGLEEDEAGDVPTVVIELESRFSGRLSPVSGSSGGSGGTAGGGGGGTPPPSSTSILVRQLDEAGDTVIELSGKTLQSSRWGIFQPVAGVIEFLFNAVGRLLDLDDVDAAAITDRQVIVRDEASETFIPGYLEDIATAAVDTALVLAPNGLGGVAFRAESTSSGSGFCDLLTNGNPAAPELVFAGAEVVWVGDCGTGSSSSSSSSGVGDKLYLNEHFG